MSAGLPETVDPWRAVAGRRRFQGVLPLADLPRLRDSLAGAGGEASYRIEFDRDPLGVARLSLHVSARLPLVCQRTLDAFELPVVLEVQLGLIEQERDEDALPPGYEALLVGAEGVNLREVIEDELILALPVVPVRPDAGEAAWVYRTGPETPGEDPAPSRPFEVLRRLKQH